MHLVVVPAGDDLLAGGAQDERVFELGCVAALDVAEWRIRVDDALIAQVLQRHLVLCCAGPVQPSLAERQSAEVLVDGVEQQFRRLQSEKKFRTCGISKWYNFLDCHVSAIDT